MKKAVAKILMVAVVGGLLSVFLTGCDNAGKGGSLPSNNGPVGANNGPGGGGGNGPGGGGNGPR